MTDVKDKPNLPEADALTGLLPPSKGEIYFNGKPLPRALKDRDKDTLRRIQMIYQSADTALNGLSAEPQEPGTEASETPAGSAPAVVDAEMKRAQAAYAAAFSVADARDSRRRPATQPRSSHSPLNWLTDSPLSHVI